MNLELTLALDVIVRFEGSISSTSGTQEHRSNHCCSYLLWISQPLQLVDDPCLLEAGEMQQMGDFWESSSRYCSSCLISGLSQLLSLDFTTMRWPRVPLHLTLLLHTGRRFPCQEWWLLGQVLASGQGRGQTKLLLVLGSLLDLLPCIMSIVATHNQFSVFALCSYDQYNSLLAHSLPMWSMPSSMKQLLLLSMTWSQ